MIRWPTGKGETLVIETTNFRASDQSRFGVQYDGMSDENLRVTERLTRTGPGTITYRATVVDPTVYTKPWTVEFPMEKTESAMFEYACHEGNYGLAGILSGARAKEKAALKKCVASKLATRAAEQPRIGGQLGFPIVDQLVEFGVVQINDVDPHLQHVVHAALSESSPY